MKRFQTTAQRLHSICIRAQTKARHGLKLHRFGLLCAMRGYRRNKGAAKPSRLIDGLGSSGETYEC